MFDFQSLEDHLIRVNRRLRPGNAEQRDFAAVIHRFQHRGECAGDAGHFQTHVEAFGHAEFAHHVTQVFVRDVEGTRRAHLAGEFQVIVVHICDDDIARANVTRDRRGHHADRTRAGDEHILADEIERKGGTDRRLRRGRRKCRWES